MADNTHHGELIDVLRELYTLLSRLGAIPFEMIQLPDPTTGVHPEGSINTEAADAAGYAPETIRLMTMLPYLAVDHRHEMFFELLPSTFPITYIGADLDEGHFRDRRELLNDAEMPPSAMRLTRSEIYGTEFIYDTATKLMVAWKPIDNPDEADDYSHVAGASPREVLSPVIEDYRRLKYLATPRGFDFSPAQYADSGGTPPRGWSADEQRRWKASYAVWEATQKLRDFYLEYGWDVGGDVEQRDFRFNEFLAKREVYVRDVLGPLILAEEEAT
ncbi:hypothetical protein F5B18DRAFT_608333, partial [Nemania serpens]